MTDSNAYDYGIDRDASGRPVLTALHDALMQMVNEEAERRARLQEVVRAALAEQAAPALHRAMWSAADEPFLRPDYIVAPVNGGPIALMRREGGVR